jgi:hypothetical protein
MRGVRFKTLDSTAKLFSKRHKNVFASRHDAILTSQFATSNP